LSRYHEKSSILRQEPEKAAKAKRDASFGVKRPFRGCPWLFLVAIITVETFRREAASHHPKCLCAGRNASERRAILEKDNAQVDPTTLSGKTDTSG
jgi:hypothetical protein